MRRILLALVLTSFISIQLEAQKEDAIVWTEDYKLTWDDFKAKPKKRQFASAMSDIGFKVDIKSNGDVLNVFVQPSFHPHDSWVKVDDKSDYLLKHEQTHFDIYEVNARKLRKELSTKKLTSVNAQSTIGKLIEKYSKLNVTVQEKYDEQTEHSIKKEKQEKWNADITAELEELKDFSEPAFNVKIEMK